MKIDVADNTAMKKYITVSITCISIILYSDKLYHSHVLKIPNFHYLGIFYLKKKSKLKIFMVKIQMQLHFNETFISDPTSSRLS